MSQGFREEAACLRDHWLGSENRGAPKVWLQRLAGPCLGFSGEGVVETASGANILLDASGLAAGRVQSLQIENLGFDAVSLNLPASESCIRALWSSGDQLARLERGGDPLALHLIFDAVGIAAADHLVLKAQGVDGIDQTFTLTLTWPDDAITAALGRFSFNGSNFPMPFGFGTSSILLDSGESDSYQLSISSLTKQAVEINLADLPTWLEVEATGFSRQGPASGVFFVGQSPIDLMFRPLPSSQFLGMQTAKISMKTTDLRQELRNLTLELSANFQITVPCVEAFAPKRVIVAQAGLYPVQVELRNLGCEVAQLKVTSKSDRLALGYLPQVPAALGSHAGYALLELTIGTHGLSVGKFDLPLSVAIEGGSPPVVEIVVKIAVIEVSCFPTKLDFGKLRPGEMKQALLSVISPVELEIQCEISQSARHILDVQKLDSHRLQVFCRATPGMEPRPTNEFGIKVIDSRVGLDKWIPINVKMVGTLNRRVVAAWVILGFVMLALLLIYVLWQVLDSSQQSGLKDSEKVFLAIKTRSNSGEPRA